MRTHLACGELKRMQAFFCRGISTEPRRRGRGMNTPSFSFAERCFACVELQRFCLDPTAAPSALWFARLLRCTSQTSVPLRFTQDDTDGCAARCLSLQRCGCRPSLSTKSFEGVIGETFLKVSPNAPLNASSRNIRCRCPCRGRFQCA